MVPTVVHKENRRQSSPVKTCPCCGNKNKYVKMNWEHQKQKISFSSEQKQAEHKLYFCY